MGTITARRAWCLLLAVSAGLAAQHLFAQRPEARLKQRGLSGNPVIEGWYADPEAIGVAARPLR